MISLEHFDEIDMRVGTVTAVSLNKRARKPAYKITVDLGDELGIKNSSAQLTNYEPEEWDSAQKYPHEKRNARSYPPTIERGAPCPALKRATFPEMRRSGPESHPQTRHIPGNASPQTSIHTPTLRNIPGNASHTFPMQCKRPPD